jgi:hypothetical protein
MPARMRMIERKIGQGERRESTGTPQTASNTWFSRLVSALLPQDEIFADLRIHQADVQRDLRYGTENRR